MAYERLNARAAVQAVCKALDAPATSESSASHVRRLDHAELGYYLVLLPQPNGRFIVATVDDETGDVQSWAKTEVAPLIVGPAQARQTAALGDDAEVELVWAPTRLSMSPLAPFWEVTSRGQRAFVDQSNMRWEEASPKGRGGGALGG